MRLAIVTPWFGPDLSGGAEQQSWQLAQHLAEAGYAIDVLTTCNPSAGDDWSRNALPAGVEYAGNVVIKRFRVDRRDGRAFSRVNALLTGLEQSTLRPPLSPLTDDDARIFEEHNINSRELLEYLETAGRQYRAFIFLPYLYGPTISGLQLVAERAFLQPCLHDEPYAYLPVVRRAFHAARGILFNSSGELEIARRIFGPGIVKKSALVGQGVDIETDPSAFVDRIGAFVPRNERYVFYLGRQDPRKNVSLLVNAYGEFKRRYPMSRLKLVLAGGRSSTYGDAARGIVDLGNVEEAEKTTLLAYARALVQPSVMESYSRVVMESWLLGRPVIVNENCEATATVVSECDGGLLAGSVASLENRLYQIDVGDPAELDAMGERGRVHALRFSSWPHVTAAYERALGLNAPPLGTEPRAVEALRQVWPQEAQLARHYADAIARTLRRAHVRSLDAFDPSDNGRVPVFVHYTNSTSGSAAETRPADAFVYHALPGGGGGPETLAHKLPTPGNGAGLAFASTPPALDELRAAGFSDAALLPICVDPRDWDCDEDRALVRTLLDGCTNLVYVGPFNALDPLDRLLTTFLHYLTLDAAARLVLVGRGAVDETIYQRLSAKVRSLDLVDRVLLARDVTGPQLQSVYRSAHLFWSLDDENSFGEGFLQAMWFDVPVLAYKTATSAKYVGEGGLLILDQNDLLAIATLAQMVVADTDLRRRIVRGQRAALRHFDGEEIVAGLVERIASPAV